MTEKSFSCRIYKTGFLTGDKQEGRAPFKRKIRNLAFCCKGGSLISFTISLLDGM